ncbi:MAG: YraN family protein [bacterium]|nr:YraN family protein [bacterium]
MKLLQSLIQKLLKQKNLLNKYPFEDIAVKYLNEKGYKIIERNFKSLYGEIDIIASKNKTLVFVEVRYKSNPIIKPELTVNSKKQNKIKLTAKYYMKKCGYKFDEFRFDVIGITNNNIEHIENAFT